MQLNGCSLAQPMEGGASGPTRRIVQPIAVHEEFTMSTQITDRIEKQITLRAPRSRVWRAVTESREFGEWFGVKLAAGQFAVGAVVRGQITHPGYEHVTLEVTIEALEPERRFAYRWHPYAIEKGVDYSAEPTTLVEFTLEEVAGGTQLTIVESGFDRIPLARRAKAFESNEGGWAGQIRAIERYLGSTQ
jgi:uncharacterized protein YndB with AHSA1/START domain